MRNYFITMLALLVFPASALGNMASPERIGTVTGDVFGDVSNLAVEKEMLRFDLRALEDGDVAHIEATYQIRNDHSAMSLELQFVAANLAADHKAIEVEFDGRPLAVQVAPDATIPERWRIEEAPHRFAREATESDITSLLFTAQVPPGRHEIRVAYAVTAWQNSHVPEVPQLALGMHRHDTLMVPYVLAPARDWGEFGTLEVEVVVPDGWNVSTAPDLQRRGQALVGSFDGIPSSAFYVELRPRFFHSLVSILAVLLAFLTLFGLLLVLPFLLARRPIRRFAHGSKEQPAHSAVSVGIASGIVMMVGVCAAPVGAIVHEAVAGSTHVYPGWSYGIFFMVMFGTVIGSLVALTSFFVTLFLSRSRAAQES